jgi:hypothetical protein
MNQAIPTPLADLLVKLKLLSMIERGKKVNVGTMSFVDGKSWWGSVQRALSGEGRRGLLVHLQQIIHQGIEAIGEYHNTEFGPLLVTGLAEVRVGLTNLEATYRNDPHTVAQLRVLLTNIEIQLNRYRTSPKGKGEGK